MTTYTNEQLASMTQVQLQAVILQTQAEQATAVPVVTFLSDDSVVAETDADKAIEQTKTAIANLETAGAELFKAEISALKEKLATLEAEAQQIGAELVTVEQNFAKKYGQAIAHGVEIILLVVIAGKLLGVL